MTEFGASTSKKESDSSALIFTLTVVAVVVTSGILLIRSALESRMTENIDLAFQKVP